MQWLILLAVSVGCAVLGRYLKPADEVYALALYATSILSALWGFAVTPAPVQLVLTILILGWLQVIPRST